MAASFPACPIRGMCRPLWRSVVGSRSSIFFWLGERVGDRLASVDRADEDQECTACHDEAERSGVLLSLVI
ncbi:hypothetical protein HYQ46_003970 [Verticillium longisporum]|nr:hypothetical protein HYQ46_003970 [Verticillium longisporum]